MGGVNDTHRSPILPGANVAWEQGTLLQWRWTPFCHHLGLSWQETPVTSIARHAWGVGAGGWLWVSEAGDLGLQVGPNWVTKGGPWANLVVLAGTRATGSSLLREVSSSHQNQVSIEINLTKLRNSLLFTLKELQEQHMEIPPWFNSLPHSLKPSWTTSGRGQVHRALLGPHTDSTLGYKCFNHGAIFMSDT